MKLRELARLIAPSTEIVLNDYIHSKECRADMLLSLQDYVLDFDVSSISVMRAKKDYKLVIMLAGFVVISLNSEGKLTYVVDGVDSGSMVTLKSGKKFSWLQSPYFNDALDNDWLFTKEQAIDIVESAEHCDEQLGVFQVLSRNNTELEKSARKALLHAIKINTEKEKSFEQRPLTNEEVDELCNCLNSDK